MLAMFCKTPTTPWFFCGHYNNLFEAWEFHPTSPIVEWYLQPWFSDSLFKSLET